MRVVDADEEREKRRKDEADKKLLAPEVRHKRNEERKKRHEAESLIDEANLRIYQIWRFFGGRERGISPVEARDMPADLCHDFMLIESRLFDEEERRKGR